MSPFEINFSVMMVVSPDAFALHSYMGGKEERDKDKKQLALSSSQIPTDIHIHIQKVAHSDK
jgi:hypothetical protein